MITFDVWNGDCRLALRIVEQYADIVMQRAWLPFSASASASRSTPDSKRYGNAAIIIGVNLRLADDGCQALSLSVGRGSPPVFFAAAPHPVYGCEAVRNTLLNKSLA